MPRPSGHPSEASRSRSGATGRRWWAQARATWPGVVRSRSSSGRRRAGEEADRVDLVARDRLAALEPAADQHLVGVVDRRRVLVAGLVEEREQLLRPHAVAALLERLALGRDATACRPRRPSRPGTSSAPLRRSRTSSSSPLPEDHGAHVHLGGRVAEARGEGHPHVLGRDAEPGRGHLDRDPPQLLVPLAVVGVARVGEPGLRDRLDPLGEAEPGRAPVLSRAHFAAAPGPRPPRARARRRSPAANASKGCAPTSGRPFTKNAGVPETP